VRDKTQRMAADGVERSKDQASQLLFVDVQKGDCRQGLSIARQQRCGCSEQQSLTASILMLFFQCDFCDCCSHTIRHVFAEASKGHARSLQT